MPPLERVCGLLAGMFLAGIHVRPRALRAISHGPGPLFCCCCCCFKFYLFIFWACFHNDNVVWNVKGFVWKHMDWSVWFKTYIMGSFDLIKCPQVQRDTALGTTDNGMISFKYSKTEFIITKDYNVLLDKILFITLLCWIFLCLFSWESRGFSCVVPAFDAGSRSFAGACGLCCVPCG